MQSSSGPDGADVLIIWLLGVIALVGFIALIVAEIFKDKPISSEPVLAVVSASVGALASRLAGAGHTPPPQKPDMEMLGNAVNHQVINQMMRSMTEDDSNPPRPGPKHK